jgi:hypothetical protein
MIDINVSFRAKALPGQWVVFNLAVTSFGSDQSDMHASDSASGAFYPTAIGYLGEPDSESDTETTVFYRVPIGATAGDSILVTFSGVPAANITYLPAGGSPSVLGAVINVVAPDVKRVYENGSGDFETLNDWLAYVATSDNPAHTALCKGVVHDENATLIISHNNEYAADHHLTIKPETGCQHNGTNATTADTATIKAPTGGMATVLNSSPYLSINGMRIEHDQTNPGVVSVTSISLDGNFFYGAGAGGDPEYRPAVHCSDNSEAVE